MINLYVINNFEKITFIIILLLIILKIYFSIKYFLKKKRDILYLFLENKYFLRKIYFLFKNG